MFRSVLQLDVKGKEDRIYRLSCESSSPMGELYDALCAMRNHVVQVMQQHGEPEEKKLEEEKKEEFKEGEE